MHSDQQFLEMLQTTIRGYLREKYGKSEMSEAISSQMKFHSQYREAVEEKNKKPEAQSTYIPTGAAEKKFYDKLMKSLDDNKNSR